MHRSTTGRIALAFALACLLAAPAAGDTYVIRTGKINAHVLPDPPPLNVSGAPPDAPLDGLYNGGVPWMPSVTGGRPPYMLSLRGDVPAGLHVDAAGLSGIATGTTRDYSFVYRITDADGRVEDRGVRIGVYPNPLVVAGPYGDLRTAYAVGDGVGPASLTVSGGRAPYSWSVTGGVLPAGVTSMISEGGAKLTLSGMLAAAGNYGPYGFVATDATGRTMTSSYFWTTSTQGPGAPVVGETGLPALIKGFPYSGDQMFFASGGEPYPYEYATYGFRYSTDGGASYRTDLQWNGLTFSEWGTMEGTPGALGTFSAFVAAVDARGVQGPARSFEISVGEAAAVAIMTTAPVLRVGKPVLAALQADIGDTWTFAQDPPTPSLALQQWPTATWPQMKGIVTTLQPLSERTTFTITATVGSNYLPGYSVSSQPFQVTVVPTLKLTAPALTTGKVGVAYVTAAPVVSQGLEGQATFALFKQSAVVDIAALCPGLTLSSATGVVSGVPTASCPTQNLSLRVTDSFDGAVAGAALGIAVNP